MKWISRKSTTISLPPPPPPPHTHTGTGKSLTSGEVASRSGLVHVDIGIVAKDNNLFEGWDEQFECPILDEDKVMVCIYRESSC